MTSILLVVTCSGVSLHHLPVTPCSGLYEPFTVRNATPRLVESSSYYQQGSSALSFSLVGHLRLTLVLGGPLLRAFLLLIGVLGHDVLKVTPQRLDGREFVADRRDFFERAVEFVDVLQDDF